MQTLAKWIGIAALSVPALAWSQDAKPDPWAPVRFMVGQWQGTASGKPGEGTVTRSYEFVLGGKFLHERNTSIYAPNENNKNKGEVHEHWSFISYDRARKAIVLRQFHVEGFVNQYVQAADKSTANKLVFESEGFENLSNKWRARETYEILGPDEFVEIFELAMADKPFEVYSTNRFKRVAR
ncbi:hypothetical protein [Usitatibacter palustris]|uniref:THAP4-like heme-binding beta-barrel domain-containing protein n=1 Tax=Usitatibacter palustris TaxID=2732487 RepID=A0A6M4H3I6_9PROT|nr:hypothetical protein [Usitatibacter palustris]QJR14086.1 hypothetical protein DSM104440_00879 [Usitatibacter palustris]